MSQPAINEVAVVKISGASATPTRDQLAAEEPLEIRIIHGAAGARESKSISVTMRTPGHDVELAAGFLFTEGIITDTRQVDEHFSLSCAADRDNTISLALKAGFSPDLSKLDRHFYTSSSCGVCGKSSIEAVRTTALPDLREDGLKLQAELLYRLPELLRRHQEVFASTGGLHASALFDTEGNLLLLREDVGRHNALDKLIGRGLLDGLLPWNDHILLLSGRASFELIQKAAVAGIKIVAAVGAPSSLAVALATEYNITLIGFLRNQRFNIYTGVQRVII